MDASTHDTSTFAALLQEAVTHPGLLSEAYQAFHRYSLGNQLLAALQLQRRGARLAPIAAFHAWRTEHGRRVRKGEKALALWMPLTLKKEDPETGDIEVRRRFALERHWFTLDQTDGPPFSAELTAPGWDAATALAHLDIRAVPFAHLDGNVQGYATGRTLALNPLSTLKHTTRFHELAHVVLGHTESGTMLDRAALDSTLQEVEAEGTAYLLCATLGLPGLEDSRAYLQHWLSGRQLPEANARRIFTAADRILRAGAPVTVSATSAAA